MIAERIAPRKSPCHLGIRRRPDLWSAGRKGVEPRLLGGRQPVAFRDLVPRLGWECLPERRIGAKSIHHGMKDGWLMTDLLNDHVMLAQVRTRFQYVQGGIHLFHCGAD